MGALIIVYVEFVSFELFLGHYGYKEEDINVLIDDEKHEMPTRENIVRTRFISLPPRSARNLLSIKLAALKNLVADAKAGDHFCFHCMFGRRT